MQSSTSETDFHALLNACFLPAPIMPALTSQEPERLVQVCCGRGKKNVIHLRWCGETLLQVHLSKSFAQIVVSVMLKNFFRLVK